MQKDEAVIRLTGTLTCHLDLTKFYPTGSLFLCIMYLLLLLQFKLLKVDDWQSNL